VQLGDARGREKSRNAKAFVRLGYFAFAESATRRIIAFIAKCAYCRGQRGYVPSQMKRT
jgi:hypothetical protein